MQKTKASLMCSNYLLLMYLCLTNTFQVIRHLTNLESRYFIRQKSDEPVVLDLPNKKLEKEKERKLSRGLLATGQRIVKAVEQASMHMGVFSGVACADVAARDVPENKQHTSDYEANIL